MVLAATVGLLSGIVGNALQSPETTLYMVIAALFIDLLGIGVLLNQCYKERKNSLHDWALAEAEKEEVSHLSGKNEEELHRILDYHMKQGNIKEADKISKQLLALVDPELGAAADGTGPERDGASAPAAGGTISGAAVTSTGDTGYVIKTNVSNGQLPEWLSDAEEEKKNLPKWMQ